MDEVTECETEAVAECGGIDARYPIGDRDRCKTVTAVNTLAMPRPPFVKSGAERWTRTTPLPGRCGLANRRRTFRLHPAYSAGLSRLSAWIERKREVNMDACQVYSTPPPGFCPHFHRILVAFAIKCTHFFFGTPIESIGREMKDYGREEGICGI